MNNLEAISRGLRTRWTVSVCTIAIACSMGIQAKANTIAITYSFAGNTVGPPVMVGTTLILEGLATGSVLSGTPSLNAIWNPVTFNDHSVIELTTGQLNGTLKLTFADGNTLTGNLFEDVSKVDGMGVGPFTQIMTFTGGTGEFAGATGSFSGTGVGTTNGFTTSGSGTINAPAIPEPASGALLLGGLAVMFVALRQSKVKSSPVNP
jgi:hypothetical protein